MKRLKEYFFDHFAIAVVLFVCILTLGLALAGKRAEDGSITLNGSKAKIEQSTEDFIKEAKIVLAKESKKALIQLSGNSEQLEVPTVESIDSSKSTKDEKSEVGGRGWSVNTSSPLAFKNAVLGQCVDTDGYYGSQCWDLGNLFWQNYAGRSLNTCGTGAAKGTIQNGCWQRNAGNEFEMIWDRNQLRAGDWVVFNNGTWGHIGMALGGNNGGYVALLGTNQGGAVCSGGGSSSNIINMGLGSFAGAFRPKRFNGSVSTPAPKTTNNSSPTKNATESVILGVMRGEYGTGATRERNLRNAGYNPAEIQAVVNQRLTTQKPVNRNTGIINSVVVRKGDTLGDIIYRNGWAKGRKVFGDDGLAQELATKNGFVNRGLIYPNQTINR